MAHRSGSDSQGVALIKDVSIIGAVVVVVVIIMIVVTMYLVIKFLRQVVDKVAKDVGPVGACAAEIIASQDLYQQKINPATNTNYTACEAAVLAVDDIAADQQTTCPKASVPYSARPPYSVYISSQCAPPPPVAD
jgi:hypothetical protein